MDNNFITLKIKDALLKQPNLPRMSQKELSDIVNTVLYMNGYKSTATVEIVNTKEEFDINVFLKAEPKCEIIDFVMKV